MLFNSVRLALTLQLTSLVALAAEAEQHRSVWHCVVPVGCDDSALVTLGHFVELVLCGCGAQPQE